jgi:hypothetical protein
LWHFFMTDKFARFGTMAAGAIDLQPQPKLICKGGIGEHQGSAGLCQFTRPDPFVSDAGLYCLPFL